MNVFVLSQVLFLGAALVALVLLAFVRRGRRHGDVAAYDWLASAVIAFVALALPIDQIGYDYSAADNPYWTRLAALGLVVFPGLLARAICALCRAQGVGLRVSDAFTVVLAAVVVFMPTFPGGQYHPLPLVYVLLVAGFIVELAVASIVSIRALRIAARGQPHIIRTRSLLLIVAQVVFSVTAIAWLAAPSEWASLVSNFVLVVVGGMVIAALVWPWHLLQLFETRPRDHYRALAALMASTSVADDLIDVLDDLVRNWGLTGAAVLDRDGRLVGIRGEARLDSPAARRMHEERFGSGAVQIVLWTSALSLPIVRRDRDYLALLTTMIRSAIEREAAIDDRIAVAESAAAAAHSLAVANERLVEADQMKSRFVSLVSHELRTPLTSIIGLAATANERWDDIEPEQVHEFVRIIAEQGDRLQRIVENLLVTSRIEAGAIGTARDVVELEAVIDESLVDAGVDPRDVNIDVAPAVGSVVGDRQAIHEILVNLLANAAKHGKPPITVRAARADGRIEIAIHDAGEGVDHRDPEQLFERFVRGENTTAAGTGLGLSIVRDLAAALDGEAGYRPGEPGSEFWVRLVAAPG